MTKDTLFLGPCQPIKSFFRQKVSDLNIHLSWVSRRTQVFSGLLYHPSKRIACPFLTTVFKNQIKLVWFKNSLTIATLLQPKGISIIMKQCSQMLWRMWWCEKHLNQDRICANLFFKSSEFIFSCFSKYFFSTKSFSWHRTN